MKEGRIDEHGTNSELLANSGSYSDLFRRQDDSSMKPKSNNGMLVQFKMICYYHVLLYVDLDSESKCYVRSGLFLNKELYIY